MQTLTHWIGGERLEGERHLDVTNPASAEVIGRVPMADTATVERAIDVARAAQPAWRDTPPAKRAQVMFRFKMLLERDADEICRLVAEEHGKVLEDAMGELKRGIENVEYACGVPELLKGQYSHN
ncbi:MAG: aldehyde dehydrogenase family protein, partial [Halomonas sp.]|uniref:aldehyde dehydrogenase family protein n=1 Tax=Halomonas sp. TaxID=1486246 RepID=UPI00286FEC58